MPSTDLPTLLLAHWPRVVLALLAAGTAGVLLAGGVEAEAGVDISADPPLPAVATDPAEFAAVPDLEVAVSAEGPVVEELEGAARRHGLDPDLLKAVAWVESSFRPDAVSAAGAVGVMQLMPATVDVAGDLLGRRLDATTIRDNVDGGAVYLAYLLDITDDEELALASYHAGWGAVRIDGPPTVSEAYVRRVRTARAAFATVE